MIEIARGGFPLLGTPASYFGIPDIGVTFVRSTETDEAFSRRLPTVECRCPSLPGGINGRSVVIADDIIRSGRTVRAVPAELPAGAASSVRVASLFAEPQPADLAYQAVHAIDHERWVVFPWDGWLRAS